MQLMQVSYDRCLMQHDVCCMMYDVACVMHDQRCMILVCVYELDYICSSFKTFCPQKGVHARLGTHQIINPNYKNFNERATEPFAEFCAT